MGAIDFGANDARVNADVWARRRQAERGHRLPTARLAGRDLTALPGLSGVGAAWLDPDQLVPLNGVSPSDTKLRVDVQTSFVRDQGTNATEQPLKLPLHAEPAFSDVSLRSSPASGVPPHAIFSTQQIHLHVDILATGSPMAPVISFDLWGDIGGAISSAGSFIGGVASDISQLGGALTQDINSVTNPLLSVGGDLTGLAGELGDAVTSVYNQVGAAISDLGMQGSSIAGAVGGAFGTVATDAVSGFTDIENAVGSAVSSVGTEWLQDLTYYYGATLVALLGGSNLTLLEQNIDTFAQDYGHALIDYAADAICPGSSVLIDIAWSIAESGKLPTLQGLEEDGVNALLGEILPGGDVGLADVIGNTLDDAASGAIASAVTTFANDISSGTVSSAGILSDLESAVANGLAQGAVSSLYGSIQLGADSLLTTLLGGSDLSVASAMQGAFDILPDSVVSAYELATSPTALAGLTPAEIIALASNGSSSRIAAIAMQYAGQVAQVDLAQALSFASAGIALNAAPIQASARVAGTAALYDSSQVIEGLSQATLAQLHHIGITILNSDNGPLAFSSAQAAQLIGAGFSLRVPSGQTVTLDCTQAELSAFSETQLQQLAAIGFNQITLTDGSSPSWNYQECKQFVAGTLRFSVGSIATYDATTSEIASLAGGGNGTLSATDIQQFAAAGINTILVSGSASGMLNIPASALLELGQFYTEAQINYRVMDTASDLIALSPGQIQSLLNDFSGITWNVSDKISHLLALTPANLATLQGLGILTLTASDAGSAIQALTAAQIATLAFDHVTAIVSKSGSFSITVAQAAALVSAGVTLSAGYGAHVWLTDSPANLVALTSQLIGDLSTIGIGAISATGSVSLSTKQWLAIAGSPLTVSHSGAGTSLIDADMAANIAALSADQIAALSALGVKSVVSTGALRLSLAQCFAFVANGITVSSTVKGGLTAGDTAFNVGAATPSELEMLASLHITSIAVLDAPTTISAAAAMAAEAENMSFLMPAGDTLTVLDGAFGGNLLQLTAAQISGLAKIGVSGIRIEQGATASVQQALALLASKCAISVAAFSGGTPPGYLFRVADSATNIQHLTAPQLAQLNAIGFTDFEAIDTSLSLSVAQIEQMSEITVPPGSIVTVSDTAQNIENNWNYLNQLEGLGIVSGISATNLKVPSTELFPSFTGVVGGPATAGNASTPFANLSMQAGSAASASLTITISGSLGLPTDTLGTLSGNGLTKMGTGTYELAAASYAALTQELRGLSFNASALAIDGAEVNATLSIKDGVVNASQSFEFYCAQPGIIGSGTTHYTTQYGGGTPNNPTIFTNSYHTSFFLSATDNGNVNKVLVNPALNPAAMSGFASVNGHALIGYDGAVYLSDGVWADNQQLTLPDFSTVGANGGVFQVGNLAGINGITREGMAGEWVTDGTAVNTHELPAGDNYLGMLGGEILLTNTANNSGTAVTTLLGAPNWTSAFAPIGGTGAVLGSVTSNLILVGSRGIFQTTTGVWGTSGQSVGEVLSNSSNSAFIVGVAGGEAILYNYHATGPSWWITNGTAAGTTEFLPGGPLFEYDQVASFGNDIAFSGFSSSQTVSPKDPVLWITNGTAIGTYELTFNTTGGSGYCFQTFPYELAQESLNGRDIIAGTAYNGTNADVLGIWSTDGTGPGTVLLAGVNADTWYGLGVSGEKAFFANDLGQIWATDGTVKGTAQVASFAGANGQGPGAGTIAFNGASIASFGDIGQATGRESVTLAAGATNLALTVPASISLNLSGMGFIAATASGNDVITAGGQGQVLVGSGAGNDTLVGANTGGDTFYGTIAQLAGEQIQNFIGSDLIHISNLAASGLQWSFAPDNPGAQSGLLTLISGSASLQLHVAGDLSGGFTVGSDQNGGVFIGLPPNH